MGMLYDVAVQWDRRTKVVFGIYDDYGRDRNNQTQIRMVCSKRSLLERECQRAVQTQNTEESV